MEYANRMCHLLSYGCLILPWAERLPRGVVRRLVELLEAGVRIACLRGWPEATTEDGARGGDLDILRGHARACVTDLDGLPALLRSLAALGLLPDFSGTLRYETTFTAHRLAGERVFLDLGEVGETAEVWLNGTALGVRLCRPYVFDVTEALRPGTNALRVEVVNTLVCEMKDKLSKHAALDPSGLMGPVRLWY